MNRQSDHAVVDEAMKIHERLMFDAPENYKVLDAVIEKVEGFCIGQGEIANDCISGHSTNRVMFLQGSLLLDRVRHGAALR